MGTERNERRLESGGRRHGGHNQAGGAAAATLLVAARSFSGHWWLHGTNRQAHLTTLKSIEEPPFYLRVP